MTSLGGIGEPGPRGAVVVALTLLLLTSGCRPPWEGRLEIMAFYEEGWSDLTAGFPSLSRDHRYLTTVMPYWYTLTGEGDVTPAEGYDAQTEAFIQKQRHLRLVPLVNNSRESSAALTDAQFRTYAAERLTDLAVEKRYDGLLVDFELLPPDTRDAFTQFIRELSTRLKRARKSLSVAVFPKLDVPEELAGVYDYPALARLVDFIAVMTYDRHSDSSGPGSVAPVDWVEGNVKYALENGVPRNKLVITLAAYGYDWPAEGRAEYLGLREILARAEYYGADIHWDDASESPYFTYQADGEGHTVWFENGYSAARRAAIAKDNHLRGVAVWRLGFEDEEYWKLLLRV